jgi:hypothetical protein
MVQNPQPRWSHDERDGWQKVYGKRVPETYDDDEFAALCDPYAVRWLFHQS